MRYPMFAPPQSVWTRVSEAGAFSASGTDTDTATDSHNPDEVETKRYVGRGRELSALADELSLATRRRASRVVALTGPPGIGKTGLALAYRARTERRARWLVGRAVPGRSGLPLATSLDALPDAAASVAGIPGWLMDAAANHPTVL